MAYWTPEQDAHLEECMHQGMSASQIGALFGVSRNAVIGRVHRNKKLKEIGLSHPPGNPGKRVEALKKRKSRAKPSHELRRTPRPTRVKVVSPSILFEPAPSKPIPEPVFIAGECLTVGRPIHLLGVHECRWPVNDADKGDLHLFCGAPAEGPWCECHRRKSIGIGTRSEQVASRVLLAA